MTLLDKFITEMNSLLGAKSHSKGYAPDANSPSAVYKFVSDEFTGGGCGHALGEIVYKALRYSRRGDPEDLLKIAAWAFVIYRERIIDDLARPVISSRASGGRRRRMARPKFKGVR